MEMNELRYFSAVAQTQNIHRASELIGISPSSISKAISKLENELNTKLFVRQGRNIILSQEGIFLKEKANKILSLETQTKIDILGQQTSFKATIGASETLLAYYGTRLGNQLIKTYQNIQIDFKTITDKSLFAKINDGEVQLGITTYKPSSEFDFKEVSEVKFNTVIGKNHPLYKRAKRDEVFSIHEILAHSFVSTNKEILGSTDKEQSMDGWRDDKFPRKRNFLTTSLYTMSNLVKDGHSIAYLPDYFVNELPVIKLKITGCPYSCKQKVYIVTKNKEQLGWINQLF